MSFILLCFFCISVILAEKLDRDETCESMDTCLSECMWGSPSPHTATPAASLVDHSIHESGDQVMEKATEKAMEKAMEKATEKATEVIMEKTKCHVSKTTNYSSRECLFTSINECSFEEIEQRCQCIVEVDREKRNCFTNNEQCEHRITCL